MAIKTTPGSAGWRRNAKKPNRSTTWLPVRGRAVQNQITETCWLAIEMAKVWDIQRLGYSLLEVNRLPLGSFRSVWRYGSQPGGVWCIRTVQCWNVVLLKSLLFPTDQFYCTSTNTVVMSRMLCMADKTRLSV
jgi:hypothetical protein